jgi:multiple sugar transport system ATP-binding protein
MPGTARLEAKIDLLQPTGSRTYATFRIANIPVMAELEAHDVSRPGEAIAVDLNLNRAALFDAATEKAI